jgi:hypothetical protein
MICRSCCNDLPAGAFHVDQRQGGGRVQVCRGCRARPSRPCRQCPRCSEWHTNSNETCRECNEDAGLRECRGCRLLLPIALAFRKRASRCRDCLGIHRPWGRPSVFHDPKRVTLAVTLRAQKIPLAHIARRLRCSLSALNRLFSRLREHHRLTEGLPPEAPLPPAPPPPAPGAGSERAGCEDCESGSHGQLDPRLPR